jgi:hypothetical protein
VGRLEKLVGQIRRAPQDVRIRDLLWVLQAKGASIRFVKGSSHVVVTQGTTRLTVPRPHGTDKVREIYVRQALSMFGLWEDDADETRPD